MERRDAVLCVLCDAQRSVPGRCRAGIVGGVSSLMGLSVILIDIQVRAGMAVPQGAEVVDNQGPRATAAIVRRRAVHHLGR